MMHRVYVRLCDIPIQVRRHHAAFLAREETTPFKALEVRLAAERPSPETGLWVEPQQAQWVLRGAWGRMAA